MKVSRLSIPTGVAGTDATVKIMRQMIDDGRRDIGLRKLAESIIRSNGIPPYQYIRELSAIHSWVQNRIRYTKDPVDVEYIQTPAQTVLSGVGDCDDFTVLLGSLAESIGHPVDIKVVSRSAGREFHHVYPVARVDGREFGLDASMPFAPGTQASGIRKSKIYPSNGVPMNRLNVFSGLGKIIPAGGDGATAGVVVTVEPDALRKVQTVNIGQRICGAEVLDRIQSGLIRPAAGTRLVTSVGKGVTCVTAERLKLPPDQPIIHPRPPDVSVDNGLVIDQPVVFPRPPEIVEPIISEKPVVYPRPPVDPGMVVPYQPVVYPRPPDVAVGREPVVSPRPDSGGVVDMIRSAGPLGLPWGVWIALGVGAVYLFKK